MIAEPREQALAPGALVDTFRIQSVLGVGGFGITYKAYDEHLQRNVALKEYFPSGLAARGEDNTTISPISSSEAEPFEYGLQRFLDEARTLAKFQQPNIVKVYRFIESNGTAYLVMDYEEGRTLDDVVRQVGRLNQKQALATSVHLLRGLREVHDKRVLHRDIKPGNILIRRSGPPVLLDFGAARQALEERAGGLTVMLTPGYAPMEQYDAHEPQGPYTDLYALGSTIVHALTGRPPPPATRRMVAVQNGDPDPLDRFLEQLRDTIDPAFYDTIRWMTRARAMERPQSAAEVLEVLGEVREESLTRAIHSVRPDSENFNDAQTRLGASLAARYEEASSRASSRIASRATEWDSPRSQAVEFDLGADLQTTPLERTGSRSTRSRGDGASVEFSRSRHTFADDGTPGNGPQATRGRELHSERGPESEAIATQSVAAATVERAKEVLASFVGPIASILVQRCAQTNANEQDFLDALAAELDDPEERANFLKQMRRAN